MLPATAAWCNGVERLQFLGSSCIYPLAVEQPMRELMDVTRLESLGWKATISLEEGLAYL